MKVRDKNSGYEFYSTDFNMAALNEVVGGGDSWYIKDLDVLIDGNWKDMRQAFKDKDIITDNYNTHFFEPPTEEDRKRGFTL
jgi:hypothetical protein